MKGSLNAIIKLFQTLRLRFLFVFRNTGKKFDYVVTHATYQLYYTFFYIIYFC